MIVTNKWNLHILTAFTKQLLILSLSIFFISGCDQLDSKNEVNLEEVLSRGKTYLRQGQYRAASIEAKNALQQEPSNLKAHLILTRIMLDVGQAKSAIAQLEQLAHLDVSGDPDYVLTLAEAYNNRSKFFSAEELLTKHEDKFKTTKQLEYFIQLSKAYAGKKEFSKAHVVLDKAFNFSEGNTKNRQKVLVEAALLAQRENDDLKANKLLDEALALGNHTQALVYKGSMAYEEGNFEDAENYLSTALIELQNTDIITPLRLNILQGLIKTLTQSGRSSEALIYSKLLAEALPQGEDSQNKFQKAIELYKLGKFQEAEKILAELYTTSQGSEYSGRMLGLVKAVLGEHEAADTYLTEHIDPEIATSKAIKLLTENKLRLKQYDEALEIISAKVKQTPNDPEILSIYALTLLSAGQKDKALGVLEKALSLDPDRYNLRVSLARIYLADNKPEDAIKQLELAYKKNPLDDNILANLSRAYISGGKKANAKKLYQDTITAKPNASSSYTLAGSIDNALGDFQSGLKHFQKAAQLNPENQGAQYGIATTLFSLRKYPEAIEQFNALLTKSPNFVIAIRSFVSAHELNKSIDKGIDSLLELSENNIQAWAPLAVLADYYLRNNEAKKALDYAEQSMIRNATQNYPTQIALNAYHILAYQALGKGEHTEARVNLMKGLQLAPNDINYLSLLTNVEIDAGKDREAKKLIEQIKMDHPDKAVATVLEGDLALKQGDLSSAISFYTKAWASSASNPLGNKIYRAKKQAKDDANKFLDIWIQKLPNSSIPHTFRGLQHQLKGKEKLATKSYEKALALNPNNLTAINNLAWLKFETKQSGALELAEKGARLYPKNGAMLDTYGWILYKNGDIAKAKTILKSAYELTPDNAEIKAHYEEIKKL